jgi:hypothetical protein
MPSLRSILSLLALGSVMVDNPMPQRVLARAVRVVALVILASMLFAALLLTVLACGYKEMISRGVAEANAMWYVLGIIFVIAAGVIIAACNATKGLLDEVKATVKKPIPLTEHLTQQAGNVVEAFVSGFLSRYHNGPEA